MKSQFVCLFCIKALKKLKCNDEDLFHFKNLEIFVLRLFENPLV